nr:DivIVA domain-containing protein [Maliibacterium massiliense]
MAFDPSMIEEKQFATSFRGYNTTEVDDFLEEILQVCKDLENNCRKAERESVRYKERAAQLEAQLEQAPKAPKAEAPAAPEVPAPQVKVVESAAPRESEKVLEEARLQAQRIIMGAQAQVDKQVAMAMEQSQVKIDANKREAETIIEKARKDAENIIMQSDQARERIAEYGARIRVALEAEMAVLASDPLFKVQPVSLEQELQAQQSVVQDVQERISNDEDWVIE